MSKIPPHENLVEKEQALWALLNAIPESAMLVDLNGTVLVINEVAARRFGKNSDELLGKNIYDHMPIDLARSRQTQGGNVIRSGKPVNFKDERAGSIYDTNVYPVFDAEERVIAFAIHSRDLTADKQAEITLHETRLDLERAQEVGKIGWWRLDTRRNKLTWSDENHRIFGVPKGTTMNYETFIKIVHVDDREYVKTKWEAGLRGEPYDIEHRIVVGQQIKWVREKAYLEFDESNNLAGGFGITQDITERKIIEDTLAIIWMSDTACSVSRRGWRLLAEFLK